MSSLAHFEPRRDGHERYLESGVEGEPPEIPEWWHFDECSSHLDARTFSQEVSTQYLPLVKRFAKVCVDAIHLGHSDMAIYRDMRRIQITTEFVFITTLKTAEVYERMFEEHGTDLKYVLQQIPETTMSTTQTTTRHGRWQGVGERLSARPSEPPNDRHSILNLSRKRWII